jgi:hypothetical protein
VWSKATEGNLSQALADFEHAHPHSVLFVSRERAREEVPGESKVTCLGFFERTQVRGEEGTEGEMGMSVSGGIGGCVLIVFADSSGLAFKFLIRIQKNYLKSTREIR